MKRLVFISLLIGASSIVSGQQTALGYFSQLPDIPGNPCTIDDTAKVHYMDNLRAVSNVLYEDIQERKEATNDFMEAHQAEAEATVMKNAGFEGEDVQKFKNMDTEHMSEADKKAMIDELMQKKMNMTYDEAMNLKSKSKDTAYMKGWSKAYSTEQMANADPEKLQADALKNKKMFDLLQKQKFLTDKMNAGWNKYFQMFDSLQKVTDIARADLDHQLKPLFEELESGDIDGDRREAIENQIYEENMNFCQAYNPRYCRIIYEYKQHLSEVLFKYDYDTLENVQHEILNFQLGVEVPNYKPGLYALEAVDGYASLLGTVFKFSVARNWGMRISTSD